ncbi:Hsp20/alpha crystallin family protein Ecym_1104 [Eremothecium cymbalariae DBVPG|uniref:SHSP domain-containing protein n=1 Tax=Eremothecium cymbalariae (strain CBS 270.75 / DBVPG 7215 / KCTC 17166 / NRRL Y-17582) TaxID=931890 RepID=G8JMK5_ERECY|nr:hypothetical protein Ecym_1104 [Eremothecium cymbalariae DBVPG\
MSLINSPFFDFFDAISDEVAAVNDRLLFGGNRNNRSLVKPAGNQLERRRKVWEDRANQLTVPPVDLFERENEYEISATLPGIAKQEDINVEFHRGNNQVIISGELPSREVEKDEGGFHVRERASGSFRRAVLLPEQPGVDVEKIEADYQNGVLTLKVPKLAAQEGKPNVHKITIGSKL